jgi:hypothetical protein
MILLNGSSTPLLVLIDAMICNEASCDSEFSCSVPFKCTSEYTEIAGTV